MMNFKILFVVWRTVWWPRSAIGKISLILIKMKKKKKINNKKIKKDNKIKIIKKV